VKRLAPALLLAVAACAQPAARPAPARVAVPIPFPTLGLERVMGQDAGTLVQLFGKPDADVREGAARKLQFASRICVLDAYLYPKGSGSEPRVSYLDAREPDGSAIDRASCVAALTRRDGGR